MTEAERLAEIDLLIEQQRKDDTYIIEPQQFGRFKVLSLDREVFHSQLAARDINGRIITRHELDPRPRHGMFRGGGLAQIPHGTMNGYKNYGCKCPSCTEAHTAYTAPRVQAYRKRKQDARPDRICANERCRKPFRPVPSTKLFCSYKCADATSRRRRYQTDEEYRERDKASRRRRWHAAAAVA